MPNLTSVHVTAGVPDIGTGDVSTIDALRAAGGQATPGAKADAAWSGSGAGSLVAVAKAMAASLAGTLTVAAHAVTQSGAWSVSLGAALPAGTNAIGKLAANDGVDIGDVTVNNAHIAVTQSGTWALRAQDGAGNALTGFHADSGAGSEYVLGISLRQTASGGSVGAGTPTDPLRPGPTR